MSKRDFLQKSLDSFNKYHMITINNIDSMIIDLLGRKQNNKLKGLIKKHPPMSKNNLEDNMKICNNMGGIWQNRLNDTKVIHDLYDKININENDRELHWLYYRQNQFALKLKYKSIDKPPRQDNKTYINYGSGSGSWPTIRYPKNCNLKLKQNGSN